MKYYQIKSTNDKLTVDQSLLLLKEIYAMNEKKFLLQTDQVLRIHIMKDELQKIKYIVSAKIKPFPFEEMLKRYYDEDTLLEIDPPSYLKIGRTLRTKNKLYPIKTEEMLDHIIINLPEGVMFTMDITREKGRTLADMNNEEKRLTQHKDQKHSYYKEKKKELESRIKTNTYTFDIDMYVNVLEEQFESNIYNFCKQIRFISETKTNAIKVKKMSQGLPADSPVSFRRQSNIVLTENEIVPMMRVPKFERFPELLYQENAEIKEEDFLEGIAVGEHTLQDGKKIILRISRKQLEKHLFLCAGTGGGKSALLFTFLDSLIIDHKQKYGATIIDPNEETLLKFLNHAITIEKKGYPVDWNKIHYVDLVDGKYLPFINLLHSPNAKEDIDAVQGYIMETLQQVYPSGSTPKIDEQLRKIIGTLLLDKKQNTIIDGELLLTDREKQLQMQRSLGHGYYEQTYKRLWDKEASSSDIDSTLRRFSLFRSPQMQRLYGIPEFNMPIMKWMDEGHIVLINTKGLTEEKLRLNAGHIISQYVMNAKSRPTSGALPHYLIIDEGKQFQLPILWKNVIPETRKFGLYLIESTQTITSLLPNFQDEIIENVDTVISGKVGAKGAKIVSEIMNGKVKPAELQNLKDRHLFVYTKGKSGEATIAEVEVEPPYWFIDDKGKRRPTEYNNEDIKKIEESIADKEAREKSIELQKRDWTHIDEIDKMLAERYYNNNITMIQKLTTPDNETEENTPHYDELGEEDSFSFFD